MIWNIFTCLLHESSQSPKTVHNNLQVDIILPETALKKIKTLKSAGIGRRPTEIEDRRLFS